MNNDFIINAGIRITKRCNMKCNYCNIQSQKIDEMDINRWKKAIDIISSFGVKDIVILGGEPTMYPDIVPIVDYIENEKNISCSLTTNAYNNKEIVMNLLNIGLSFIGVSVDNLNSKESISPLKARNGLNLIKYLIEQNQKSNMINYTVLNKKNIDDVIDLIKYMNDCGVYTYILPFHWGNENSFEHRKNNEKFAIMTENDIDKYCYTIDEIIKMKKEGYLIKNQIEFFEMSKSHIKDLNWKCNGLSELRVDCDGKMVCCCDNKGSVNDNFTIFDLESRLKDFFQMRQLDAQKCKGCLWPSSYEAEYKKMLKR